MLNILVGDSKCLMSLMSKAYALAISSLASSWPITPNCKIPATTIPYGPCTVCDDRRVPWKQTLHASLRPMRTSEKTFRERGRQKLRARASGAADGLQCNCDCGCPACLPGLCWIEEEEESGGEKELLPPALHSLGHRSAHAHNHAVHF